MSCGCNTRIFADIVGNVTSYGQSSFVDISAQNITSMGVANFRNVCAEEVSSRFFIGDGSKLTNISNSGSLPSVLDKDIIGNVTSNVIVTKTITSDIFIGNGSGLTGIPKEQPYKIINLLRSDLEDMNTIKIGDKILYGSQAAGPFNKNYVDKIMILNSNSELEDIFVENPTNVISNGRLDLSANTGLKIDHIKFESNGSLISYSGNIAVKQITPEQTSNIANVPWKGYFDFNYATSQWIFGVHSIYTNGSRGKSYVVLSPKPDYPTYAFEHKPSIVSNSSSNFITSLQLVSGEFEDYGFMVTDAAYSSISSYKNRYPTVVKEDVKRPCGLIFAYTPLGAIKTKYICDKNANYHKTVLTEKGSLEAQDTLGTKITSITPEFEIENGPYTLRFGFEPSIGMHIFDKDDNAVWTVGNDYGDGVWENAGVSY